MIANVLFLARHHVASLLRQRETLLWVFGMPFLFFYFIGSLTSGFGGAGGAEQRDALTLVTQGEGGFLVEDLVRRLERERFAVQRLGPQEPLEAGARALFAPPVPAGFEDLSAALLAGEQVVLELQPGERSLTGAQFDHVRMARAVYGLVADMALAPRAAGQALDAEALGAYAAKPRPLSLRVERAGQRLEIPSGYEQTIPGTLVMFTLMILLMSGAILLVIERAQGLLRRLAAAPISRGEIVAGKWIGMMALALVQIGFAMLIGRFVFGMDWGPDLPMVCVVLFIWAAFSASLAILLASLARSEAQMSGLGVLVSLVLAALGGCWWPIEVTPDWMQSLAALLPTGWVMGAMHELVSFGHGAAAALPHCAALLAGALLLGCLGARAFRYQ